MKSLIFSLCLLFIPLSGYSAYIAPSLEFQKKDTSVTEKQDVVEFKFTNEEISEVSKWKSKSEEEMWNDAFKCDRAALYMGGMCLLTGKTGFTIDVSSADLLFSVSASFGFAPSVKQLIHKNIEKENIFLILVYTNLMTSLGHDEYIETYHTLRDNIMRGFGCEVLKEVEKIAALKKDRIDSNIKNLANAKNKESLFVEMSCNDCLIDDDDFKFDQSYWLPFTKFQKQAEDEAKRFENTLKKYYPEFSQLYNQSRANFSKAINKKKNDATFDVVDYIKVVKKALRKAEELIAFMEKYNNAENDNIRKISKEFLLLAKDARGVLQSHYDFFLEPSRFLQTESCINKFAEYTAGVQAHLENIEEVFEKLNSNFSY